MVIYKDQTFRISHEAAQTLPDIFAVDRLGVHSNQPVSVWSDVDGNPIQHSSSTQSWNDGSHSISHSLNVLAELTPMNDWIDQRTPIQIRSCTQQLTAPRPKTLAEAKQHRDMYGTYTGKALWSNLPPKDPDLGCPFTHAIELRLSPTAREFYYRLSVIHKMRSLALNYRHSQTNGIAACLEAIGSKWLAPPEYYQIILQGSPNTNMARSNAKLKREREYNPDRMSNPFHWEPFTMDNIGKQLEKADKHYNK